MNSVNLIGNIGADPELKQTQSGKSVTSFNLAVKGFGDKTDWFTIVAWNKTAELICKYFNKGSKIGISGRLEVREYTDKQGNNRKAVEVVANDITFIESKGDGKQLAADAQVDFVEIDEGGDLPL